MLNFDFNLIFFYHMNSIKIVITDYQKKKEWFEEEEMFNKEKSERNMIKLIINW
jgi:hypothetical protein